MSRCNTSVLEALHILHNASDESLRSHSTKLKAIVKRLQPLIEDCDMTISIAKFDTSYSSEALLNHSPDQRISPQNHLNLYPRLSSPIEKFISTLYNKLENIGQLQSQVNQDSTKDKPVRIQDDAHVFENQERSPSHKLHRGLSQRSLASEFERWEQSTYGVSRVIERTNRKFGHIAEFLRVNEHRFYHQTAVRKGIEHGIKLLICERLVHERGISAILFFCYQELRSLKFLELDGLENAIENGDPIKKLAQQQTSWLDQHQRNYDGKKF